MSVPASSQKPLRRQRPVRRRPKRSVWRKTVFPFAKLAVMGVIVVVLGTMIANKIVRPFKLYGRETRETQQLASELKSLKQENQDLERRIKYLKTPEGAARAARELGWVKPGEITLVIPHEELPQQEEEAAPAPSN